ncbi:MAG: hypothetical protein ACRBCS_02960 [Cellvibrionaceae bacterium]
MSKTHWKLLVNPNYIGAYALPDGNDITVTIEHVGREIVTSTGGKKEECTVAQLKGNKPLILNVTNQKSIAKLYGPYIEDWAGKQITLCASQTKLAGEMVECIRIRPQVAQQQPQKDTITADRFEKAVESIKSGNYTIGQLKERFILNPEQNKTVSQMAAN